MLIVKTSGSEHYFEKVNPSWVTFTHQDDFNRLVKKRSIFTPILAPFL